MNKYVNWGRKSGMDNRIIPIKKKREKLRVIGRGRRKKKGRERMCVCMSVREEIEIDCATRK